MGEDGSRQTFRVKVDWARGGVLVAKPYDPGPSTPEALTAPSSSVPSGPDAWLSQEFDEQRSSLEWRRSANLRRTVHKGQTMTFVETHARPNFPPTKEAPTRSGWGQCGRRR